MIFSTLVLLFCFTWSIRLKTAAAAGHGSARTDQNYGTLDKVKEKLQQVGLESSNLIIGVDFTKSNEWTGRNFSQFLLLI